MVNADIRKLEKICCSKVPSKSAIPNLIKQFDEGYAVLRNKTDDRSSSATSTSSVNPVKALWEMKGINFPDSYRVPNQQSSSKVNKINSSSSAAPSEAMFGAYGEPRNKSEEDSYYEMGVKLSMEDSGEKAISTDVCDSSDTSDSEEESTQGLNLLFKAANILDDLMSE